MTKFCSLCLLLIGAIATSSPALFARDYRNTVEGKAGILQYGMQGASTRSGSEISLGLEWQYYLSKVSNVYAGYRTANDTDSKRTLYQASALGMRIFPFTTGVPIEINYRQQYMNYDFSYKPYFDYGMTLGRYMIQTAGNPPVFEASSNFFGIVLGTGIVISLPGNFALDFSAAFEHDRGYNSPLAFNANTIHINMGMLYYL